MSKSNETIRLSDIVKDTRRRMVNIRILRLWIQKDKNGKEEIEMILMDEWENKIQANISTGLKHKFVHLLKEGQICNLVNFQVIDNDSQLQKAKINHAFRIAFGLATKVTEPEVFENLTENDFQFVDFKDIHAHNRAYVLDVLGEIKDRNIRIDWVDSWGQRTAKINVILADADGTQFPCVLWGSIANQLKSFVEKLSSGDKEPLIIALQFVMISSFKGVDNISTMKNATKMFIRPEIQEVKDFIKRRGVENGTMRCNSITPISMSSSKGHADEWLNVTLARTIKEIKNSKEDGIYICKGTIIDFNPTETWFYDACGNERCNKGITKGMKKGDICKKCNREIASIVQRYLLKVFVEDDSHAEYFIVFEDCALQLIGKTASQVMEDMAAQDGEKSQIPDALYIMLEKECLFKVQVGTWLEDRVYTVKMITEDPDILSQFSTHRNEEVNSKFNNYDDGMENSYKEEDNIEETCSTSATQLTPLKRSSDNISQVDVDGGDIQLYATKNSRK